MTQYSNLTYSDGFPLLFFFLNLDSNPGHGTSCWYILSLSFVNKAILWNMIYYTCALCTGSLKTDILTCVAGGPDHSGSRQTV